MTRDQLLARRRIQADQRFFDRIYIGLFYLVWAPAWICAVLEASSQ